MIHLVIPSPSSFASLLQAHTCISFNLPAWDFRICALVATRRYLPRLVSFITCQPMNVSLRLPPSHISKPDLAKVIRWRSLLTHPPPPKATHSVVPSANSIPTIGIETVIRASITLGHKRDIISLPFLALTAISTTDIVTHPSIHDNLFYPIEHHRQGRLTTELQPFLDDFFSPSRQQLRERPATSGRVVGSLHLLVTHCA